MARGVGAICFGLIFCKYLLMTGAEDGAKYKAEQDGHRKDQNWSIDEILSQFGIKDAVEPFRAKASKSWHKAQQYDNFAEDWNRLQAEQFDAIVILSFLSNTTLPAIYRVLMHAEKGWTVFYLRVMNFTREKCDNLLGPKAHMHPWNVAKQNRETVSYFVLIYSIGLVIVFTKLFSFWNLLCLTAAGYLAFVFGGPYLCFRWLVFLTGSSWYLLEALFSYPVRAALVFLFIYFWSSKSSFSSGKQLVLENRKLNSKVELLERRAEELNVRLGIIEKLLHSTDKEESS